MTIINSSVEQDNTVIAYAFDHDNLANRVIDMIKRYEILVE